MIIRAEQRDLVFITQPDHAATAADLVAHFDGFRTHPRRDDIALAVRGHDDGWDELDRELVFDTAGGRALDFIAVPETCKQMVWPRAVDRLRSQSPYAAALVAEHALFVYAGNRGRPDWQGHFDELERRRQELLERSRVPLATLVADYPLVGLADLLSLAFCHRWTDARERLGHTVRREDDAITITPSPLSGPVHVTVRARRVPDRPYLSAAALREALEAAPLESIGGIVRGGSPT